MGLPPTGGVKEVEYRVCQAAAAGGGLGEPLANAWLQKLALVTWKITSLMGKEPELVHKVEKFQVDIVRLTLTHSKGSGTSLHGRG